MAELTGGQRMTEEECDKEVLFYRQEIMEAIAHADPRVLWKEEVPALFARFYALSQDDRAHFWQLCTRLLQDEQREVVHGTIKLIQSFTRKDRQRIANTDLSLLLAKIAENQKYLREDALFALWHIGTRQVLPLILLFAETGSFPAFYLVWRMIQTPEEIEQGIALARRYIDAKDYELRETALFLLQKYSSLEREAECVLAAAQKYLDETFIDALKEAPPDMVLQPLKELLATLDEKYAEYGDVSSTIRVLEQKKAQST